MKILRIITMLTSLLSTAFPWLRSSNSPFLGIFIFPLVKGKSYSTDDSSRIMLNGCAAMTSHKKAPTECVHSMAWTAAAEGTANCAYVSPQLQTEDVELALLPLLVPSTET